MTWVQALADMSLEAFEDPVSQSMVPKSEFAQAYGPALALLDGADCASYVDFYFTTSPMRVGYLVLRDDDARADLFDLFVDEGLVSSLGEIQAGETHAEKARRNCRAKAASAPPSRQPSADWELVFDNNDGSSSSTTSSAAAAGEAAVTATKGGAPLSLKEQFLQARASDAPRRAAVTSAHQRAKLGKGKKAAAIKKHSRDRESMLAALKQTETAMAELTSAAGGPPVDGDAAKAFAKLERRKAYLVTQLDNSM